MNYVNVRRRAFELRRKKKHKLDESVMIETAIYYRNCVGKCDVLLHRKNYVMFTGRFILAVFFDRLRNAVSLLTIELPCQLP